MIEVANDASPMIVDAKRPGGLTSSEVEVADSAQPSDPTIIGATVPFTDSELEYLAGQRLGRLATVQPNGTLQASPVGFAYNADTATIDIGGYNMAASRKFRNVADNGRVAFVVDDIVSVEPWRVRCLEIRGHAEAIDTKQDGVLIRIHPARIISFGLDEPDQDPHLLTPHTRSVTTR